MKKKNPFVRLLNWIKDAGLKGLAVFLIVAAGLSAYAATVSFPENITAPSGLVGTFVGISKVKFDGSIKQYENVNELCDTVINASGAEKANANAHICTPDEMINSYNNSTSESPIIKFLSGDVASAAWINNGPPGFTASAYDCKGWSVTDKGNNPKDVNYGAVWNFKGKTGSLLPCNTNFSFACCK